MTTNQERSSLCAGAPYVISFVRSYISLSLQEHLPQTQTTSLKSKLGSDCECIRPPSFHNAGIKVVKHNVVSNKDVFSHRRALDLRSPSTSRGYNDQPSPHLHQSCMLITIHLNPDFSLPKVLGIQQLASIHKIKQPVAEHTRYPNLQDA